MLTAISITKGEVSSRDVKAEALIEQISNGDVSALGELYDLIGTDIFAYALSKTANKEDAEDT